ncbi:unnamed protein product [Paramecium sonneborni]|uniref:Uncharacterized protein n=1 Tax=Paramecium sonneborni TaxID=65129 RepID=A0A8S1LPZ0_9CILI|nr:unnamed protein product [Paramecium sonneborni]
MAILIECGKKAYRNSENDKKKGFGIFRQNHGRNMKAYCLMKITRGRNNQFIKGKLKKDKCREVGELN